MPDGTVHKVRLVRHLAVARRWQGRCYGRSDAGLSQGSVAALPALAQELASLGPEWVVHSGLQRSHRLAVRIAALARCPLVADARWQERDFASWEGESWQRIFQQTGNAMDGMIDAPATFRPGGGETSAELAARAVQAWQHLPPGFGVVISHGGPIASLVGLNSGLPVRDWLQFVPRPGEAVELMRNCHQQR